MRWKLILVGVFFIAIAITSVTLYVEGQAETAAEQSQLPYQYVNPSDPHQCIEVFPGQGGTAWYTPDGKC